MLADPTKYALDYSYSGFAAGLGDGSFPGTQLDNDLTEISESIDTVVEAIKSVRRSDGAVRNASIGYDQLKAELKGFGFNPPSEWATATSYIARDTVFANAGFYSCAVSHTSDVFVDDLATGKWTLIADFTLATSEAAAHAAAALASENAAAASLALTNADAALTHADVDSTNADVALTNANVVLTGLDVDATNADVVLTNADALATAADRVQAGLDASATAADRVQTGLDATNAAANAAAAALAAVPIGAMFPWFSEVIPAGYIKVTDYVAGTHPALDAVYPDGMPDVANRVLRHLGDLTPALGQVQNDQMLAHDHQLTDTGGGNSVSGGALGFGFLNQGYAGTARTVMSAGGPETRVKSVIYIAIVKAYGAVVDPGTLDWVALEQAVTDLVANAVRGDVDQTAKPASWKAQARANLGMDTGYPLLHVRDEKPSGTSGGVNFQGDQRRTLNTVVVNEITGASLATNIITLPAGTYDVIGSAPGGYINHHRCYLRAVASGTTLLLGSSEWTSNTGSGYGGSTTRTLIHGRIVLTEATEVDFMHFTGGTAYPHGMGFPSTSGKIEVYAELQIRKLK